MITIKNRLDQPLMFNLNSGGSLHMMPKQKVDITFEDFKSTEIQIGLRNEDLIIVKFEGVSEEELDPYL